MNKTIILVGVCDKPGSTNISQAKTFIQVGYKVLPLNYRTIIQNYGMEFFENLLIDSVKKYKPSLVLFAKCNGINPEIVKECTKYIKTWLWNPDPITTIQSCSEVLQHARYATFASCTGGGVVEWFKEQGVDPCYHIFEGIDTDIYKPVEPIKEIEADISFIGTGTPLRDEYKKLLEDAGYNTKFYGPSYNKEIVGDAFAQVCSSSQYMLSVNTQNDIPDYFSDRVFRYAGCGACVLHLDETGTMDKYFKDGREIVLFKNKEELLQKLKQLNANTAKNIALNGRGRVLWCYTWLHTVTAILGIVNKEI